jgi:L-seryl-tRNA(Ser) seleniumtransferase
MGGIVDTTRYALSGVPNATDVLSQGADLVILAGDRFLGGPPAGIVLGHEAAIERLRKAGLFTSLAASPLVLLPLAATLELHQDLETAERTIPVLALASTSLENLKHRAERLATQLGGLPHVDSATANAGAAFLQKNQAIVHRMDSWEVHVQLREKSAEAVVAELLLAPTPVVATVSNGNLVINLRTVLPCHDMHVVDAFEALLQERSETDSTASDA